VVVQGLLGGFRVRLNALMGTDLAALHGCLAQVLFALLVSLALCTSRGWSLPVDAGVSRSQALKVWRLALLAAGLVFVQLVFGAVLRHTLSPLGQRGHLLTAFAVVAAVAWLAKGLLDGGVADRPLRTAVFLLALFVFGQVLLGIEAWLIQFPPGGLAGMQPVTVRGALVRTGHVLLGSGVLATAVAAALRAYRLAGQPLALPEAPVRRLEGAA
jgi:heme A synthase